MRPEFRRLLMRLLAGALLLPIAILLLLGTARLLAALGDTSGAAIFDLLALIVGLVWLFLLVCLPIALSIESLTRPPPPGRRPLDEPPEEPFEDE